MNNNIEKLWEYACCGDIESLKRNIDRNNLNIRYNRFDKDHSLIMGAFRNNEFEAVDYLLSIGEFPTIEELKEINLELTRIKTMQNISSACYFEQYRKEINNRQ